ncbi:MAG: TIGR04255 family protein [Gammaproteobacteria bacterium]|nr:TIGR04255 family protein [Gammaproteobacteria bacterium]
MTIQDFPSHLPNAPLHEVVLGVQFSPLPSFTSVDTFDVWSLFSDKFPQVEEHRLIPPAFEVFTTESVTGEGGSRGIAPSYGSRLWFVSENDANVIQFQRDRFLLNWRRRAESDVRYTNFEEISNRFSTNLERLSDHLAAKFKSGLEINQAEVSYIDRIPVKSLSESGSWVTLCPENIPNAESLYMTFSESINDAKGNKYARLHHELRNFQFDSHTSSNIALRLTMTFRGKPMKRDIAGALDFIEDGQKQISSRFWEITTESAHDYWERKQND